VRAGNTAFFAFDGGDRIPTLAPAAVAQPHDLRVYSPFRTNDAILELVRLVKFVRRRSLLQLAAAAMAAEFRRHFAPGGRWVLVPVPMHPSARRRRGFNQADVLADGVAHLTDTPVVAAVRKRVRTRPQSLTARPNRQENVKGVFETAGRRLDGRAACLVDDLVTTGATAAACAAVALSAGARKVAVLCLARSS
jgi:ComF family protein